MKKNLKFDYQKMEAENHGTIPYISLFNGLRYIFSDWQLPQEKFEKGLAEIDKHYKAISTKYDLQVSTPENIINRLGYNYLRNKDFKTAIEVLPKT